MKMWTNADLAAAHPTLGERQAALEEQVARLDELEKQVHDETSFLRAVQHVTDVIDGVAVCVNNVSITAPGHTDRAARISPIGKPTERRHSVGIWDGVNHPDITLYPLDPEAPRGQTYEVARTWALCWVLEGRIHEDVEPPRQLPSNRS